VKKSRDFYPDCPEAMIITLSMEGDRDAFTELVKRKQSLIRNLMRRLCSNPALADDLSQQVFLQTYLKISRLKDHRAFGAWLKQVAISVWLQHCRKRDLLKDSDEAVDLAQQPGSDSVDHDLNSALAQLAPSPRLCVVLSYQEGMTHQEISETTDIPLGTVKSHINRATAILKQQLGAYQAKPTGALNDE
jgi:RNA polymerase sigma factor (sigma-70 family)